METINATAELPMTFEDALELCDKKMFYTAFVNMGHRRGQAWMNSLPIDIYSFLTGSLFDPFYRDSEEDVIRAAMFYLERG